MAVLSAGLLFLLMTIPFTILGQVDENKTSETEEDSWTDFWIYRLTLNLLGYGTIFVPAVLLIRHLRKIKYNEIAGE